MQTVETDVLIVGGGILGLWVLNLVKSLGYDAILVEKNKIGGIQTINSQGIIHGGLKYALNGVLSDTSRAIGSMPQIWNEHLEGKRFPDLSNVKLLSNHNHLWSQGSLISNVANFFTSKLLRSKIKKLSPIEYPEPFNNKKFKGQIYQLYEKVINIHSLIEELILDIRSNIIKIDDLEVIKIQNDVSHVIVKQNDKLAIIKAKKYMFTAGKGNQKFSEIFPDLPKTQLRPLHMSWVTSPNLPIMYAHCIEANNKPKITITSHITKKGISWYCGGNIAEQGVKRTKEEQLIATKEELESLFPWINFNDCHYGAMRIDRAEPCQEDSQMPSDSYFFESGNKLIAWPTKLALTPVIATEIIRGLDFNPGNKHKLDWETCEINTPDWNLLGEKLCSTEI